MDRGERVRNARKRAGLTQAELSEQCPDVSLRHLQQIERGEISPRLYALRQIAVALRVRTTDLQDGRDAEYADADTEATWAPVRDALIGRIPPGDEPATFEGVRSSFDALRMMIGSNQYAEIAKLLPGLLRDLDQMEDHEHEHEGRTIRARILNMTGWLLTQCRQFDAAEATLARSIDAAEDRIEAAQAVNTLTWAMLRQGQLDKARDLAIRWADEIEPRMSRARAIELSTWGRLWLTVANAAVRNNAPGEMADALALSRSAAARIGREIYADVSTVRTFGPTTVDHIVAESHALAGEPMLALAVAERTVPATLQPVGPNRLRHRLDIANAYAQLGQYPAAITEIERTYQVAPEWLVQQRYGRDVLGRIIDKRRTLTVEMRELADKIQLEY